MSDSESDGYGAFDFSEFTSEDLAQIDAHVERSLATTATTNNETRPIILSNQVDHALDESFEFDTDIVVNFSELTEEELLRIDRAVAEAMSPKSRGQALAKEDIEEVVQILSRDLETVLEGEAGPSTVQSRTKATKPRVQNTWSRGYNTYAWKGKKKNDQNPSLMDIFRRKKILSVSDLVGPAWCEVQYDYGLRQKRSRPIKDRPTSFKTSKGKEITIKKQVAAQNDVRTKQGQAVHKELEREIRAEEVKVNIASEEERWGLRLVNMMACFRIMQLEGFTREMPVFGIVNGETVTGIIDEIRQEPCTKKRLSPSPERKPSPKRRRGSPSNTHLLDEDWLPTSSHRQDKARQRSEQYKLFVVDTKTRSVDWLPPEEDTYQSRLQVMLYRRLLSSLLSLETPFDFRDFWWQVGVDSTVEFSTLFLTQSGLLFSNTDHPTTTLDGLAEEWRSMVADSGVVEVDPNLELIYRLQPKGTNWKGKWSSGMASRASAVNQEQQDLAKAIAASLAPSVPSIPGSSTEQANGVGEIDEELQKALYESLKPTPTTEGPPPPAINGAPATPEIAASSDNSVTTFKTIGTKQFLYDDAMLQGHLDSVLEFWKGLRQPVGVPPNLARRCEFCEYKEGCEWREERASEFVQSSTAVPALT
ncbi:exonuclease V a 5' deoxyribonuclease-domain-containing protein [Coprinopsis sp. MPI-PUGE-AT-0042]|nr:exonuclease V a 5' deoxyribonuclease-domain-containing protein [Coprinopsis sp. MPI-PUGE-AT-0042]